MPSARFRRRLLSEPSIKAPPPLDLPPPSWLR
jgi:hypothetical protein